MWLSSRCHAVIVAGEKEQERLLLLLSAAACGGCRGTIGEAPGRECTIQVNHQGHQCNETRSVFNREKERKKERK